MNNPKLFEKKFGEYFQKLIYASFEDIERDWNGDIPYSSNIYQSYKNLCKEEKDRVKKMKGRFVLSDQIKQFLTFFFGKMIEEIAIIDPIDEIVDDDISAILTELEVANTECYTVFMYNISATFKNKIGATLKTANDPSRWFYNQIVGSLPQYAMNMNLITIIASKFDDFLKSMAWLLGKLLFYHEVTISAELFLGTLAQQGMSQLMLDLIQANLRAKPAAKPRAKKPVKLSVKSETKPDDELGNLMDNIDIII